MDDRLFFTAEGKEPQRTTQLYIEKLHMPFHKQKRNYARLVPEIWYHKHSKIGTPKIVTVSGLNSEQFDFPLQ